MQQWSCPYHGESRRRGQIGLYLLICDDLLNWSCDLFEMHYMQQDLLCMELQNELKSPGKGQNRDQGLTNNNDNYAATRKLLRGTASSKGSCKEPNCLENRHIWNPTTKAAREYLKVQLNDCWLKILVSFFDSRKILQIRQVRGNLVGILCRDSNGISPERKGVWLQLLVIIAMIGENGNRWNVSLCWSSLVSLQFPRELRSSESKIYFSSRMVEQV